MYIVYNKKNKELYRNNCGYLIEIQGPHSRNFPKTFSKDLPMSDDLGIPKKFSYPNSRRLSLRFQRSSSFLISVD